MIGATASIWQTGTTEEQKQRLYKKARDYLTQKIRRKEVDLTDNVALSRVLMEYLMGQEGANFEQANEITESILVDVRGYGVIDELIRDPLVSDIYIHSHDDITYEKMGKKYNYNGKFRDRNHLMMFIEKLAFLARSRVDISNPIATFTLPEGYRTAVAIPPVAVEPTVAIRKFVAVPTVDELIQSGYFSPEAGAFFKAAVKSKRNILFTGGMGTGKTTMIAIAGKLFDEDDYVLMIEEVQECPWDKRHSRRLVARPPSVDGTGEVSLAALLKLGLMMKPSRVIVSEVRDGAIFYMLQAMIVGHEGSMSTIHANSPQEALFKRIPSMLSMSAEAHHLSHDEKVAFAANAIHLIIHLEQDPFTGERYCARISEVVEEPQIDVVDIFVRVGGRMVATGHFPERCARGAARYGVQYDPAWFRREE